MAKHSYLVDEPIVVDAVDHNDPRTAAATLPDSYGWRLWRGWNVWEKHECEHCGSMHKLTSGKPRNKVRQWIVVRFGR